MDEIIAYLKEKYHPVGILLYGSFASGTNGPGSDFDALVLWESEESVHDHGFVGSTQLDVFVQPRSTLEGQYDIREYLRVWDGKILLDELGLLKAMQDKANAFIQSYPGKPRSENEQNLAWCEKMLRRAARGDTEGFYRLHWLLTDSLEVYFDLKGQYYLGPKKGIRKMLRDDPAAAAVYDRALRQPTPENLAAWVALLKDLL